MALMFAPTAFSGSPIAGIPGFTHTNACPLVSEFLAASSAIESNIRRGCNPVAATQPLRDNAWKVRLSKVESSRFDQDLTKAIQVLQLTPNELLVTSFLKGKPIDIAWDHSLHRALHYCQRLESAGFTDVLVYLEEPKDQPGLLAPEAILAEWFAGAAILHVPDESGIASFGQLDGLPEYASSNSALQLLMQVTSTEMPLADSQKIGRQFQWQGGILALQQELLKTQWTNFRRNGISERYICTSY